MAAAPSEQPLQIPEVKPDREREHTDAPNPTDIDAYDAAKQIDVEKADISRDISYSASPCPSEHADGEQTILSFAENDSLNPYNWKQPKKVFVVISCTLLVMNSTIGSSIAAGGSSETGRYFNIKDDELLVLPVSIYLVGYVIGPLVFAVSDDSLSLWIAC